MVCMHFSKTHAGQDISTLLHDHRLFAIDLKNRVSAMLAGCRGNTEQPDGRPRRPGRRIPLNRSLAE